MDREAPPPITARRLKEIASLKRAKGRREHSETLVEGVRSVRSLAISKVEMREVVINHKFDINEHPWLTSHDRIHVLQQRKFEQISDVENSQGIIAVAPIVTTRFKSVAPGKRIIILDTLADPGNAGAILRSAAWFGIDHVVGGPGTVDLFNPKVVRSSMGGIWDVEVVEAADLAGCVRGLKKAGYEICVADMDGDDMGRWVPAGSTALVIGNEARGVSAEIKAEATRIVSIPRTGQGRVVESLNAAISCSILLQHWCSDE